MIVFDHTDHIGTRRGRKNHQLTGGSCFIPGSLSILDASHVVAALNAARVANDPPAAAATTFREARSATGAQRPARWGVAVATILGSAYAVFNPDPIQAVILGSLPLLFWALTRMNPLDVGRDRVHLAADSPPFRRIAPYLLPFAVPCIALGALLSIW